MSDLAWLTTLNNNIYNTAIIAQFKHISETPDVPFDVHLLVGQYNDVFKACTSSTDKSVQNALIFKAKEMVKALILENDVKLLSKAMSLSDTEYLTVWVERYRKFKLLQNGLRIVYFYLDNLLLSHSGTVPSVLESLYQLYYDEVYVPQSERLFSAIRNSVKEQRKFLQTATATLVRNACASVVDLGKDTVDGRNDVERGLRLYRNLSPLFVEDLRSNYSGLSTEWANTMHFGAYVDKVKEIFVKEVDGIVTMMLVSDSNEDFRQTLHDLLIKAQLGGLLTREGAIPYFLNPENSDKLALLYSLSSSDHDSVKLIADKLENHLSGHGRDQVKRYADGMAVAAVEKKSKMTEDLIRELIDLNHSYEDNICRNCDNNATLKEALSSAFKKFINYDRSVSKYLAEYAHLFQCSQIQAESVQSNESTYANIASLYSYIREKDVYQMIHSIRLSQRLLHSTTVGLVQERELVERLHQRTGDATWRNQAMSMIDNVQESAELSKALLESSRARQALEELGMDFHMFVCTDQMWPTQTAMTSKTALSPKLQDLLEISSTFYLQQPNKAYNQRKLTWRLDKGTADLRVTFASGQKTLTVTTLMMLILSALDNPPVGKKFVQYDELLNALGVKATDAEAAVVRRHLLSLVAPEVGIVMKSGKELQLTDKLMISKDVAEPFRRVAKIVVPLLEFEDSADTRAAQQGLQKGRIIAVEAALVRVMKARKTSEMSQVRNEVAAQVTQFVVDNEMFKSALEQLIEKEYLKRSAEDRNIIEYLA